MTATHTDGPWKVIETNLLPHSGDHVADLSNGLMVVPVFSKLGNPLADAHLIAASPETYAIAKNFQITGPDDDGMVWLILHGNGTTGQAMVNLGHHSYIVAQVALHLEADRKEAVAKAEGGAA